jgi:hypothetical protein
MEQRDVQPGETLRQLAERTWRAWNDMITSWLCVDGKRVLPQKSPGFARGFCRDTQNFHGFYGFDTIKSIGVPFEEMWRPPNGCTGDEPIDISNLPPLPYRAPKPGAHDSNMHTTCTHRLTGEVPITAHLPSVTRRGPRTAASCASVPLVFIRRSKT